MMALQSKLEAQELLLVRALDQAHMFLSDLPNEGLEEPQKNMEPTMELAAEVRGIPGGAAGVVRQWAADLRGCWEHLVICTGTRRLQVDAALEKLQNLQGIVGQLGLGFAQAEEERAGWPPVGDLPADSLRENIEKTTAFRENMVPLDLEVKAVNKLSAELSALGVQVSSDMFVQISNLNAHWILLQPLYSCHGRGQCPTTTSHTT
ncbi:hypothetical protein AAFF_G00411460 [Aldrovandia affinis]|uniref:Uncharacterized protein n=1 Tax=Aldrovandia affinis TaxID=143900 RepID=A0AAD7WKJ7_9TELE|nr:hypothetical protein AAFF_G00411460 [Aldrovandia affinis]